MSKFKYYGVWFGGPSYIAIGRSVDESLEVFPSLAVARERLADRFKLSSFTWKHPFERVDGTVEYIATPTVDDSSEIHLWRDDPRKRGDAYPDYVISFGPRGGVRVESTWSNGRNWGVK